MTDDDTSIEDGGTAGEDGGTAEADAPATDGADAPTTDGGVAVDHEQPFGVPRWVTAVVPLVLLAVLVGGFLVTTPLGALGGAGEPLPSLSIDYTTVPDDFHFRLHVTNTGATPVTISQVMVDEAHWNFEVLNGDRTLQPRESAVVSVPYHWNPGFDYEIAILTERGATFHTTVVATQETPGMNFAVIRTLAVAGFLVGVVPVALGMLWFPYLRTMDDRWLHAVLAFSAGILAFLVFDAGFEAFELAEELPGIYAGRPLMLLTIVGSMLVLQAVMDWTTGEGEGTSPLALAYAAALGIGLHNLAEGLAIGSAFSAGRLALGSFLIVGFMIHNVTEGPIVVAPLARSRRPSLGHFAALGLLAGAPAILGGWVGNAFHSPVLVVLFLAIGVGALLQVIYDVGGFVRRSGELATAPNIAGFLVGLVVMYATDLLVVL